MPVENTTLAPVSDVSSSILAAWPGPVAAAADDPWTAPPDNRRAELERLGDRIAELSARIQAATYELLVLIRQFDERNGWESCTSCAHWLSWRTGLAPGAAREHVRVARALGNLPKLSDAMRRGVVSYSKVRAVTRVATPETEQALLDVALCGTAAHVEQIVRGWRRVDRTAEQKEDRRRHETRSLRTWVDDDGMVVVQGRLTPEVGAVLRRALEAACDQARGKGTAAGEVEEVEWKRQEELAPTLRAAAGGRDRCTGGMRAGRRSGSGDGGRPVSGGRARGCRCAGGRAGRSRGNVRDVKDGSGGIRPAKRRCPARSRGNAGGGARRSVREQPDRAGRSGRDPRFGRDGPAAGLRRCHGEDATRSRR